MTPHEFTRIRDWITHRWTPGRIWGSDDIAAELYYDFGNVPLDTAMTALRNLYYEGTKHAPTPSEILAHTRRILNEQGATEGYQAPCEELDAGHPWAIFEYGGSMSADDERWVPAPPARSDDWKYAMCPRCGLGPEWRQVKTISEIEDLREKKKAREGR